MSMTGLARTLRPQHSLRHSLMLTALVVAGVVLALVTMHSLSLDHSATAMTSSVSQHDGAMTYAADDSMVSEGCGVSCAPGHSLIVMGCILALVGAVLVVARIRAITVWHLARRLTVSFTVALAALPVPEPPSLHVLSISRT